MHQGHLSRKQLVDTVLHDGMGLSAADFHQRPRPGHDTRNCIGVLLSSSRITVLFNVLHASPDPVSSSSRSPICFRYSKVCRASASSTTLMANPTWTMTYSPSRASGT